MKTKIKSAPVTTPTRPLAISDLANVVGGSGATKSTVGNNPLYQGAGVAGTNPLHKT